jgi:uncharacterized protein (TIGR03118 family)
MTRSSSFQVVLLTAIALGALCAAGGTAQAQFKQTDLASDISRLAKETDPSLKNTWGLTAIPGATPIWINAQGTATSSLFSVTGNTTIAPVNLNGAPGTNFAAIPGAGGPTGIVGNSGRSFGIAGGPAAFIFANLNGTISAWNLSNINIATKDASTVVATTTGASYTGLAISTLSPTPMLYAANGNGGGSIQVFDSIFTNVTPLAHLSIRISPLAMSPSTSRTSAVTYALAGHGPQTTATAGQGAVAVVDESGNFQQQLVGVSSTGELASPWGMGIAHAGFGAFGGAGNTPGGLWGLMFGGGGPSGDTSTLFFTDGISGETDGLSGALTVPEPSTWATMLVGFRGLALFAARRRRAARAIA